MRQRRRHAAKDIHERPTAERPESLNLIPAPSLRREDEQRALAFRHRASPSGMA